MASTEHMTLAQLCKWTENLLQLMYSSTPDNMQWIFDNPEYRKAFLILELYKEGIVKPTPRARALVDNLYMATEVKREEMVARYSGKRQEDTENT